MKRFALAFLFFPALLFAQQQISMADAILKGRTSLAPANLRQQQWIPGTSSFSYVVNNRIVRTDAASLATDTLNVLPEINAGLTGRGDQPLTNLPACTWLDARQLGFQANQNVYVWTQKGGVSQRNHYPANAANLDLHWASTNVAYTAGDTLRVSVMGTEQTVAYSESKGIVYGKSVHRDEFGIHKGTFWSPSGQRLAFYRMDESMVTEYPIYVLDSMPAQVRDVRYPFAGSKSHHVTVGVYDARSGTTVYLKTGEPAEQYLTNVAWSPDEKYILIAVVNRGQNHLWLNQYDAATGAFVKTLFEETSDKWVEPEHPAEFVPGSNAEFVWQSERDGFNHLYRYDLSGKLLGRLSRGNTPVTNGYGFSADGKNYFFQTADTLGLNRQLWVSSLKTGEMTPLSDDYGTHNALVAPSGEWLIDQYSDPTTPRTLSTVPVKKPAARREFFSAPDPLANIQLGDTRIYTLLMDSVNLNCRLILPPDYDPNNRYPALVYVYNGPHVQMITNSWLSGGELWMHHMAQQGVAVFVVDGRGSDNRGFAFESAIHRRLGDVEVQDQLAGLSYLKSQRFIDTTRIGIFGWSYGGFMTTSLMTRPEAKGAFRCGVAGGPVIDWRMYEIMYTERYMDTPQENPAGYDKASLFQYIGNLDGRLLMIHGSSDDVVLWQHTLRYIRECVRQGKQIDYFVYPEHLHNVMGKDRVHLFEKIGRFFMDNLKEQPERP